MKVKKAKATPELHPPARGPDAGVIKKKKRNGKKNKKPAIDIQTLGENIAVSDQITISKKGKKKKKKNVATSATTPEAAAEVTVQDKSATATPTANKKKKNKDKRNGTAPNKPSVVAVEDQEMTESVSVTSTNPAVSPGKENAQRKNTKKQNRKMKKQNKDVEMKSVTNVNGTAAAGTKKPAENGKSEGKKLSAPQPNEDPELRTIYVGNVSTKTRRKDLARFFSKYGKVETVRLRCAAVSDPQKSKKEAVVTGNFHEKRTSLSAYLRFTHKEMVEDALKANGTELHEKHLRVDRAEAPAERDTKKAVFLGNLSFEAEEENLLAHFAECGEIESVRIVRDKNLASGKGFGYVNFLSEDSVELALRLNNQLFMHRQLRVQRCVNKKKKNNFGVKASKKKGLSFMKPKAAKLQNAKKQSNYSGVKMMENKKFKKMKAKGKFTKEDRKKLFVSRHLTGGKPNTKKTK